MALLPAAPSLNSQTFSSHHHCPCSCPNRGRRKCSLSRTAGLTGREGQVSWPGLGVFLGVSGTLSQGPDPVTPSTTFLEGAGRTGGSSGLPPSDGARAPVVTWSPGSSPNLFLLCASVSPRLLAQASLERALDLAQRVVFVPSPQWTHSSCSSSLRTRMAPERAEWRSCGPGPGLEETEVVCPGTSCRTPGQQLWGEAAWARPKPAQQALDLESSVPGP